MLLKEKYSNLAAKSDATRAWSPGFGFALEDLYEMPGLSRVDAEFMAYLAVSDAALAERLSTARSHPENLAPKVESELLIALAPHVDDFIGRLFGIEQEVQALAARHHELAPLYTVKRLFVQRKAMHKVKAAEAATLDGVALTAALEQALGEPFTELSYARHVTAWQQDEATNAAALDTAMRYAAWAAQTDAGRAKHAAGVLFKAPHKLDHQHLVPCDTDTSAGYPSHAFRTSQLRRREGFRLTDNGTDLTGALDEANYCIWSLLSG
jgi:hypothetical protein